MDEHEDVLTNEKIGLRIYARPGGIVIALAESVCSFTWDELHAAEASVLSTKQPRRSQKRTREARNG